MREQIIDGGPGFRVFEWQFRRSAGSQEMNHSRRASATGPPLKAYGNMVPVSPITELGQARAGTAGTASPCIVGADMEAEH